MADNIHTEFHRMLKREDKERLLGQTGKVFWLYGLSGSGKSTIANAAERKLHAQGRFTQILDGDNIRSGLNQDLGFTDADRQENIRRIAEVTKLFVHAGCITFASFITPQVQLRELARSIVGAEDFVEVYVHASFETCAERDVKGLYAKAKAGGVKHFTGKDSTFEIPENPDLRLDTESCELDTCVDQLLARL